MIVDDKQEIIHPFIELLSESYNVITALRGKIAIDKMKRNQRDIDLVLLDYKLPDISGLDVLKAIKQIKPCTPVILITAYGDENIAVQAFRHGVKDYIKKPFSYDELIKKIDFNLNLKSIDKCQERKVLTDDTNQFATSSIYDIDSSLICYNLQRCIKYIHDNYMNKMSLDKVAFTANMSKYHFSRKFSKSLGFGYQCYLNKIRIERAKELLKDPNLSITEVAFSVGYSDLSHFERIFKKLCGCNPKQYRHLPIRQKYSRVPHPKP